MAIPVNILKEILDTDLEKTLGKHILQGTTNTTFNFTLLKDGETLTLDGTEVISAVVIYNIRYETQQGKRVRVDDGNYVLKTGDSKYNITISGNEIVLPFAEEFTNAFGLCKLIIKIDNGNVIYTYSMNYNVDENMAYSPISTPNNLPTYNDVKQQVDALTADNQQIKADLTQAETDIAENEQNLNDKADKDLSNIPEFDTAADGDMFYKKGGKLDVAPLKINDATKVISSPYSIEVPPNTLHIGDNTSLKENGGFLENHTRTLDKNYLMLDYENDPQTGTKKPIYYARGAMERYEDQPNSSTVMNNVNIINLGTPSFDHQAQAIYFKFVNAVNKFKMKININGNDVAYYPSKTAWNDDAEDGYNVGTNLQKITLEPFWSHLVEYNMRLYIKADSQINLLGNGTLPYIALDINRITRHNIALADDITGGETAEDIRNKLQTLTGDDRLDASAVKNLPSGGTVDNTYLTFKKSLGVTALNKTGNTINANTFVFVSPQPDGTFHMQLITKNTKYSGELFGMLRVSTANNNTGDVQLIATLQTGVTAASEGMGAWIGFDSDIPGDNSISINTKDQIPQLFGRCGVFGAVNSIGEYNASFNALEVQSSYLVINHHDKDIDYHSSLPTTISTEALFVYLHANLTTGGQGTIFQQLPALSDVVKGTQIWVNNESTTESNKVTLQANGTDKINNASTYDVLGQKHKVLLVATSNEWSVFYDSSTTGTYDDTQVKADIAANKSEIERLKTDISSGGLPTYVFRDKGVPVLPATSTQNYKAYYIHSIVLPDSTQVIDIPSGTIEDTIFSVENNDRTDYLSLRPPAGETINGNTGVYQCTFDTLNYFVKSGTDWTLAYGGVFPNNLTALKSTIQSLLTTQLHTMDEITAQLKDRLHTFREIQTEFSDQLHTYNDVEGELNKRGYNKGMECYWELSDTNSIDGTTFTGTAIEPNQIIATATGIGNKYLVFTMSEELSELIDGYYIDTTLKEFVVTDFTKATRRFKLMVSSETMDISSTHNIYLNVSTPSSAEKGITIDDGTNDKSGITKLNVKGMYLDKVFDDSSTVDLKAVTSWETLDGMGGGRAGRVLTETPLETFLDPSTSPGEEPRLKMYLKHDYFELSKPPGYLAYLVENEEIMGRVKPNEAGVRQGAIWFDDNVVGGNSPFIEIDKPNKALGIQDYTDDDPVVTGGIPTLIAFRVAMKDKAPNDGFVELLLKKTDEGTPTQDGSYLLNANGQPIGIRKQYKSGDDLGVLDAMAIYMAKGLTKFQCIFEHSFADDGVLLEDRTEGASGILIQALGTDYATGDALLQFENDTMQNIEMSKHYNGEDIFNIAWALTYDRADVDITAWMGQTSVDGLHFYNNTNLKLGVADKTIHIHDNGTDLAYFNLGNIFSAEKTYMLRGKELDIKVTLQDKQNAFRIYMAKWTGNPDAYTKKVIASYDADTGAVADTNWALDGSIFITKDAVSGEHDFAGTLTVPADAVNFAVVIAPGVEGTPTDLYMKGFEVNVSDPFYGWILEAPELVGEKHLQFDERHAELRCDVAGYVSIRYTLNNVPAGMPMPIGVIKGGKADIEIDHTINQVTGTALPQFEGAIKFNKEGKALIQTDLYVHSKKSHATLATTKFWYSKVSTDGNTFTKIPLSEYTTQVRGQTKAINKMPKFEIDVQPNDRIALFGTSDQADGAFIDQNAGDPTPMLKTIIDFDEITAEESDLLDRITELELHTNEITFVKSGQPVSNPENYRMEIDVDTGRTTIKVVNP